MTTEFKIGDKVRVMTTRHGSAQYRNEGVVIPDRYPNEDLPILVEFPPDSGAPRSQNAYAPKDLELIQRNGASMNKLTADKYEISRDSLKSTLNALIAGRSGKIKAIKLLRAATGWGLKESKDYVESDMTDSYSVGDRVNTYSSDDALTVRSILINDGQTYYWLADSDGDPSTYGASSIKGLSA